MKWRSKGSADAAATEAIGTVPQFDTRLDSFDDLGDEADVTSATQDPQYNASTPPTYNQSQEMSKSAPPPRPNAPPTSQPGSSTNVAVKTNTVNQPTPAAQSATQLSRKTENGVWLHSAFSSVELGTMTTDDAKGGKMQSPSNTSLPIPDYVDADTAAKVKRLRTLTKMLDKSFTVPYFGFKVGVDPMIGLIPVVGDCAGLVIGSIVIAIACNYHVPKRTIAIMLANQSIDCAVGVVPLAGDIFDVAWKANAKNLYMIEQHLLEPDVIRRKSNKIWKFIIAGVVAFIIVNCVIAGLIIWGIVALATR